jgi:hypothetical protein
MTRAEYIELFGEDVALMTSEDFRLQKSKRSEFTPLCREETETLFLLLLNSNDYKDIKNIARHFPSLREHVFKYYNSWNDAIEYLTPCPEEFIRINYWNRFKLLDAVKSIQLKGEPIYPKYLHDHYPKILSAIDRVFDGSV